MLGWEPGIGKVVGDGLAVLSWAVAVSPWSLMFAAPHFYWASGGRSGLGAEARAADEALAQPWFFFYNLLTGVLALATAVAAVVLASRAAGLSTAPEN